MRYLIYSIEVVIFLGVLSLIYIIWKANPFCPKCKNNLKCRRNKEGRAICEEHGDVTCA